jgi:hypothetical protein
MLWKKKRPLFIPEYNFRSIVKIHLEELMLIECNYWRKRCTVRWIKMSEDNTKFFHAMATQRMRRNVISMLKAADGRVITDHDEMAGLLWSEYKQRLGTSVGIQMKFDLARLASLPFTYLGFPLGTARPQLQDLMPLVFRLERRLTSISHFLSQGARLQLVDLALSSMSVYFLCSLSLPLV